VVQSFISNVLSKGTLAQQSGRSSGGGGGTTAGGASYASGRVVGPRSIAPRASSGKVYSRPRYTQRIPSGPSTRASGAVPIASHVSGGILYSDGVVR